MSQRQRASTSAWIFLLLPQLACSSTARSRVVTQLTRRRQRAHTEAHTLGVKHAAQPAAQPLWLPTCGHHTSPTQRRGRRAVQAGNAPEVRQEQQAANHGQDTRSQRRSRFSPRLSLVGGGGVSRARCGTGCVNRNWCVNGEWCMVHGAWRMARGAWWRMARGAWCTVHGA